MIILWNSTYLLVSVYVHIMVELIHIFNNSFYPELLISELMLGTAAILSSHI